MDVDGLVRSVDRGWECAGGGRKGRHGGEERGRVSEHVGESVGKRDTHLIVR